MSRLFRCAWLMAALLAPACDRSPTEPGGAMSLAFDFADGAQGFGAGFADYPDGQEVFYELVGELRALPSSLGGRTAWFLSGNNHSDDLFMYLTRRIDGLVPRAIYRATFTVEIATDVPRGCGGAGGSPGESVWLKTGASTEEPRVAADELGSLRLNVDKGNQAVGGADAVVVGTIENSVPCEAGLRVWELKSFQTGLQVLSVRADATGAVWLLAGTDSGFEATTSIYVTRIGITLEPS